MKGNSLRKIIAVLVIVSFCQSTCAQSWMWTESQPITDSVMDNRNACMAYLQLHGEWGNYIFWERSLDESSKAIYYRNLYTADAPQAIHEMTGVHYRNPQFIETWNQDEDTLCFFFYETNESGNPDIYYQVLTPDGFSEPTVLAATPADESNFRCNGSGTMTWQEGDKIRYALLDVSWNRPFTLSAPATLDSLNCFSPDVPFAGPDFGHTSIAWLKGSPEDAVAWYSYYNWQSHTYSSPQLLADEPGTIRNMRFDQDACYGAVNTGEVMAWENVEENNHTLRIQNLYYPGGVTQAFQQEDDFMPIFSDYVTPSDEQDFHGFLSFIDATSGNGDIRVSEMEWELPVNLDDYYNVSNSSYPETNPDFFNGACSGYYCDLILTWESLRDGHWQIWYSTANLMCAGGTGENGTVEFDLRVYPNPAHSTCVVSYDLPADTWVSLKMYTLDGRQLLLVDPQFQYRGANMLSFSLNALPPGMKAGMVMIKLETGKGTVCRKVMVSR